MFSAVTNLGQSTSHLFESFLLINGAASGASGAQDITLADTGNGVLYALFALTGLVAGSINNRTFPLPRGKLSPLSLFLSFL